MGRGPCCEKMELRKGPWTHEEDQILISYINMHNSHGNWRALPKRAGLLRCGKSCRLRWMNYLRPDIKRGNFTTEEEETIIKLHAHLGNKWSVIAANLPGRTDNEIKNVWHTHLKKRLIKPIIERNNAAASDSDEFSVSMMTEMGDSFWSEVFSRDDWSGSSDLTAGNCDYYQLQFENSVASDYVDLWHNIWRN